ncbi:hypothetical protein H2200_002876 [Cladophialophora chaetospira]|uniref:SCP domain-containing protein n=1 Tax=Cladophialophora chaetospira TaxID=386627 RepID=A0AA39CLR9_9EURO|nr:hypothetical protein H2200_002876 [Cladophialophora chaetospira]
MRAAGFFFLATGATAQSISYVYTATFTETAIAYFNYTTCPCPTSSTVFSTFTTTTAGPSSGMTTTTPYSSILLPSDTIVPSSLVSTSAPPASSGPVVLTTSTTTTTTSSGAPVVTNLAYINAILRHHNIHRQNHTAVALVWNPTMAEYAREIAETCVYGHVTSVGGGGYGQNIGAGFPATPLGMGQFITEGLYNSEVNNYHYYGGEPDVTTLNQWGHFSQIVWKGSASVGCYTADCSSGGLTNAGPPIPPYFTVCNYAPPGNVLGAFAANVGVSIGLPTVHADY